MAACSGCYVNIDICKLRKAVWNLGIVNFFLSLFKDQIVALDILLFPLGKAFWQCFSERC